MNYWIFKCNPKKYRLEDRLNDSERIITWRVTRYKSEIGPNDIAFIWKTGSDRGICAVMRVDSFPKELPELESEKQYCVDISTGLTCRVTGELIDIFNCVSHGKLRNYYKLTDLPVFQGFQQATNFRLSRKQGEKLMEVIEEEKKLNP